MTLKAFVRAHLEELAQQHAQRQVEREALERRFNRFQFQIGEKRGKREDLYERS